MTIKDIKTLAQIMEEKNINILDYSFESGSIRLERNLPNNTVSKTNVLPLAQMEQPLICQQPETEEAINFNNLKEIKSPMIGVYYGAPSPDAKPFVEIGSQVKKGDVLCIIEAMKLMNEITADVDGEIVDICATDGEVVEFSTVLFKIF